ncbi:hypothetical protein ATZ36_06245 [Candidatus Endomicrobiellum trichonymphae]|uniref:Uncharacterized protein n=1 Tax=Endomicrobium trichonymphae TaxID=1408204 RepID=A0A1E5IHX7_ENDTX|nr:hypothetical protein ATZ36_06245 [Candidatus Endomicrobium trichonymphae]
MGIRTSFILHKRLVSGNAVIKGAYSDWGGPPNGPINEAKKEGTTLSDVIGDCLEKKYGSGKGKVYKPKCDENALNDGIDK